jgi:hypothetical protein
VGRGDELPVKIPRTFILLTGILSCGAVLFAQEMKTAQPVSAAVNAKLPFWLHFSGEERARLENIGGAGLKPIGDLYLLNRLRLTLDVRPTNWLSFRFQAEDSRVLGQNTQPAPASQKDAMDLRMGYIQLGGESAPVSLAAGRQRLDFGDARLVGDPGWSNVGRTFDAARLTLRHGQLKVDVFSGMAVKVSPLDFDEPTPGQHFDGVYGSLGGLIPNAKLEPYVLWRMEHNFKAEGGRAGNLDEKTTGLRWVGKLPLAFDYTSEFASQFGSWAGDGIASWMGHWVVGHSLADTVHRPRIYAEYNRASGNADAHDGRHSTFDPLFPSPHDNYGLTDLFGSSNIVHVRGGFEYKVSGPVAVVVAYNDFRLENPRDGLYVGGKVVASNSNGRLARHVGQEPDVRAQWTLSRSTTVIVGYGRLFSGDFLRRTNPGVCYNLFTLSVAQRF